MQQIRKLNNVERGLLEYLVKEANIPLPGDFFEKLLVQKMDDNEMGGFLIFQDSTQLEIKRKFGKQVGEFQFTDDDGVSVIVSLYVDDLGSLLEVDVWKVDFSPVINFKIPS